jgi:S-formylglutathione hydrolase FrmB
VSLTSSWFLWGLSLGSALALLGAVAVAPQASRRRALWLSAVTVGALALWFRVADPVHSGFPPSFFLWGAAPVFTALLAVVAWRRVGWRHRLGMTAAVPLCLVFAAATVNAHYAYFPSLAVLRGRNARDQTSARAAVRIVQQARTTATLPVHGVVLSLEVPATRSGFHARGMFVYLPPAWFATPRPSLPVVLLIAGTPGTPADWTRSAGADVLVDEFTAAHHGVGPILVMPDVNGGPFDDTECVDGPRGQSETYLLEDVRPFVIEHFGAASGPRAWAVGGLSEGGTCALVLSLRHPESFGSFADFGGQAAPTIGGDDLHRLYGGDRGMLLGHSPDHLLAERRPLDLGGWFEVGTSDRGARAAARRLASLMVAAGGSACLVERSGIHNFTLWHDALRDTLPWLAARIGITSDATDDPCRAAGGHIAGAPTSTTSSAVPPQL